jgi:hypothetical protein
MNLNLIVIDNSTRYQNWYHLTPKPIKINIYKF